MKQIEESKTELGAQLESSQAALSKMQSELAQVGLCIQLCVCFCLILPFSYLEFHGFIYRQNLAWRIKSKNPNQNLRQRLKRQMQSEKPSSHRLASL